MKDNIEIVDIYENFYEEKINKEQSEKIEIPLSESMSDKGTFKAVFLAGSPYAGKTYTMDKIIDPTLPIKILNTDDSTEFLAKKYGIDPSDAWSILGRDKVQKLSKEQITHALNAGLPIIIDGTSTSTYTLLKRKDIVESLGYDTAMVFVDTALETALNRLETSGRERKVSERAVRSIYDETQKSKPYYENEFDTFIEIENDEGSLTDEVINTAYNTTRDFFNSEVENPLHGEIMDTLDGDKFLVPNYIDMGNLRNIINGWYTRK